MSIFHLTFPKFQRNFLETELSFSIGNIKSRVPSVGQFILHCFKPDGSELLVSGSPVYTSNRFVITPSYQGYVKGISLTAEQLSQIYELQIELILYGITSENPCWFNQIMLEVGDHTNYHKPDESMAESTILFNNNNYAVLYGNHGNSLQVIRPLAHDNITTKKLLKSQYTVLAPHLDEEPVTDTPSKLMMEFINQAEQSITIDK